MNRSIDFIVVENRQNETLAACVKSAALAGEHLVVVPETDAGAEYAIFLASYVHFSSNTKAFEIICFRRYFLLLRYLQANPGCEQFVLIDSDVLLFRGVGQHFLRMLAGKTDFSGSVIVYNGWDPCQVSPHVSYWTRNGVRAFVDYILKLYCHPLGLAMLSKIAEDFRQNARRGGVSDMTLLYLWSHESGNVLPCNRMGRFGVVDHNINIPHNYGEYEFQMQCGTKRITYIDGQPYLTTVRGGLVKALALHFQGAAKRIMRDALLGRQRRLMILAYMLHMARSARELFYRWRVFITRDDPLPTTKR